MSWAGIDGRGLTLDQLQDHIDGLPATTWASGMVLHNTAAPTLAQWTPANAAQRIKNLEKFFRDEQGWSAGPHAFVDDNFVWLFTPFTKKGVHSPSWNGTKIGIEMVGDYEHDAADSGRGLKVVQNTVALFAMLHTKYGWNPETIKLHREDPKTTHACPGKHIDKSDFIDAVQQYMGAGGDHDTDPPPDIPPPPVTGTVNVGGNDTLNMRANSSGSSIIIATLKNGSIVNVLGDPVMNGSTKWLRVSFAGKTGWVSARYVTVKG